MILAFKNSENFESSSANSSFTVILASPVCRFLSIVLIRNPFLYSTMYSLPSPFSMYLSFNMLSFTFSKNKKIDLTWKHCLMIYEEIIGFTEKIFEHEKIKNHTLIKDIVVES